MTATAFVQLPMLDEAPAKRVARGGPSNATIVLRSPGQPDVALVSGDGAAQFELSDGAPLTGDLVLQTDAVNRLLTLWGRYSPNRTISASGDTTLLSVARFVDDELAMSQPALDKNPAASDPQSP